MIRLCEVAQMIPNDDRFVNLVSEYWNVYEDADGHIDLR